MPTPEEEFERLFGPEFGHGRPLERAALQRALAALGAPEDRLPPAVHVAGTNGKGSVIAFLRAVHEAAGLQVHAFTKPHRFDLTERFTIAGSNPSAERLIAAARAVAAREAALTCFDAQVAAAFTMMSGKPAARLLLETGMGGRDDSTMAVRHVALSVLTPIDLDHQAALGDAIDEIAAHKAGIIRRATPVVSARQLPAALAVIEAKAEREGAPLLLAGRNWDAWAERDRLIVQTEDRLLDLPKPSLAGAHQIDNAGLAIAAALALDDPRITEEALAKGVRAAIWPGRLERLRSSSAEVWLDGGHNPHAARALAAFMRERRGPSRRAIAILALRQRKDAAAFIAALAGGVDAFHAAPLASGDGIDPETLAQAAVAAGREGRPFSSFTEAADAALTQAPAPLILIAGSFALAGEAVRYFR